MRDIADILADRGKTHGDYNFQAQTAQAIKAIIRGHSSWGELSLVQRESLDMIAHKISRICLGDPDHIDHWDDIAGYARLVSIDIERSNKA